MSELQDRDLVKFADQTIAEREMGEFKSVLDTPTLASHGPGRWDGARMDREPLQKDAITLTFGEGDNQYQVKADLMAEMYPGTDKEVKTYSYYDQNGHHMMYCQSPYLGDFAYDGNDYGVGYKEVPADEANPDGPKAQIPVVQYVGDIKADWQHSGKSPIGMVGEYSAEDIGSAAGKNALNGGAWLLNQGINALDLFGWVQDDPLGYQNDGYTRSQQVVLPQGIKNIDYIFEGNTELQLIPEIPDSVESAHCAFKGCTRLNGPSEEFAPNGTWNLKNVQDLTYMFAGCTDLERTGFDARAISERAKTNPNSVRGMIFDCHEFGGSRVFNDASIDFESVFSDPLTALGISEEAKARQTATNEIADLLYAPKGASAGAEMSRALAENSTRIDELRAEFAKQDQENQVAKDKSAEGKAAVLPEFLNIFGFDVPLKEVPKEADGIAHPSYDLNLETSKKMIGVAFAPISVMGVEGGADLQDNLKAVGSEFADVGLYNVAANYPGSMREETQNFVKENIDRQTAIFDVMAGTSGADVANQARRNYYMNLMTSLESQSEGAMDGIRSTDEWLQSPTAGENAKMYDADWTDKAQTGLAEINSAYATAVMDSLHTENEKYHFMNLEDWMKIEDMSIYGVNTSDLVYYQPGQELHPEGASLEAFREKAGEVHMENTWKDLQAENPGLPSYADTKEAVGKIVDKGFALSAQVLQDLQSGKLIKDGVEALQGFANDTKEFFTGSKRLTPQGQTEMSEEEIKKQYNEIRERQMNDPNYKGPAMLTYEEAKEAVSKLADQGLKAVGDFAKDVQSGEFGSKVVETGKNIAETVKTGAETLFGWNGSKKLQAQEGLSDEEAKAREAYEKNKTENMPSYEEAKENVGKVLEKGAEAIASGKILEEGKKVFDDLVDKVKTGAETLWNGLTGQKPAEGKQAKEQDAQTHEARVKEAERRLGDVNMVQSEDHMIEK